MSDNLKAYEYEIRADERKRVGKALEALYKRALRLGEMADALAADLGKLNDAHHPVERSNGSAPQVKAKRTVTAKAAQVFAVFDALKSATEPLTIKNVAQVTKLGPKIIGAALRACITSGSVIEHPRGKFRAVAQPAVADGAGE